MQNTVHIHANSAMLSLITDLDIFDGACDPAFDNDLDDLERQFAALRINLDHN
jgi:hypothetical protein